MAAQVVRLIIIQSNVNTFVVSERVYLIITPSGRYTPSGRTGSALVWHARGRAFQSRLVQQVLRFVGSVNTVQYVDLRGTAHEGRGATSQLDIQSLTPLSVAGCGRLQLGVLHWPTSVITAST